MPEPTFNALVEHLPEVESRRHIGVAQLTWLVHSALGGRGRPRDYLPAFAQVTLPRGGTGVPECWEADVRVAADHRWLRQELLDAVMTVSEGE